VLKTHCIRFRFSAIIITAPLNDASTILLLSTIELDWTEQARKDGQGSRPGRQHTKILLIDMAASSLDTQHGFYKYLSRMGGSQSDAFARNTGSPAEVVSSNLLVLTLLNDRHRLFLNAAGLMATMQNFRAPLNGNYKDPPPSGHRNASLHKLYPYRNLLPLYDTIVTTTTQSDTSETSPQFDFVVLDIVRDAPVATYKWRPLLILESDPGSRGGGSVVEGGGSYISHSIHPGYDEWLLVSSVLLWQCGAICWTIAAICVCLLVIMIAGIVAGGIAMR